MKYKLALFIGRFQPFHNGHLYSLKKCFELAENVIVGVGSSQESRTENNPWNFEERKQMIENTIYDLGFKNQEIIAIPDTPSDEEWVRGIISLIQDLEFKNQDVVIVSNNEWVTRLMGEARYPIFETGLFQRDELEGVKIRKLIREKNESWKLRVPEEVAREIDVSFV